jgi:hypothetical protein
MNKLFILTGLLVAGCVTVPIPPVGENPGQYGHLEILVKFHPNLDKVMKTFLKEEPKPTSSK